MYIHTLLISFCFFSLLSKALDLHYSVIILRLKEGLDYSNIIADEVAIVTTEAETAAPNFLSQLNSQENLPRNESFISAMSQGNNTYIIIVNSHV